ncbi:MAG: AAA family ATPase [Candidatus Weimeria sp.]
MQIKGVIKNLKVKDLTTGYASFDLCHDGVSVPVCGFIPDYPDGTPVKCECSVVTPKEGKSYFRAEDTVLFSDDFNATQLFLQDFNGIGKETAEKIVKETGVDIFSYIRHCDKVTVAGIKQEALDTLAAELKEYVYEEEMYRTLTGAGADVKSIMRLYDRFGEQTLNEVKKNPYIFTLFGKGRYAVSEHLAKAAGIPEYDSRRIHCITLAAMMEVHDSGDTVTDFDSLIRRIRKIEDNAGEGMKSDLFFVGQELLKDDYALDFHDDDVFISLSRDRLCETRIASNIKRLMNSSEEINKEGTVTSVSEVEKALGVSYSPDQRKVLLDIRRSGVYIITGGPGTGKTTLLKGLLYKYHRDNPDGKIILCSPTGAAARRMSESTGRAASTIHRLLNIRPFEKDILDFKRDMLDASLVVCDETSMLDEEIAAVLLSTIKNGSTVLFLGDKDQLPSVGAGDVMGDLLTSGYIKSFFLTTVFRQEHGSLIVDNARKVINGNTDLVFDNKDFCIIRKQHDYQVADAVCKLYDRFKASGNPHDLRIFSSVRKKKFVCSTTALNCRIKKSERKDIAFSYGPFDYSIGERIVFVKNNYAKSYYNGQEGVITGFERTARGCSVYIENEDGEHMLTSSELSDIEPAFAITAHKAQGSECDIAVIGITKEPAYMNLKKILYVEITRAKRQVIIVSERDALEDCIRSRRALERRTGLKREMEKAFAEG